VYGIFLDERNRDHYQMTNPCYAVVRNYVTVNVGGSIVEAVEVEEINNCGLTGLIVDIPDDPQNWQRLDALEVGYDRIKVTTLDNEWAYMYVAKY
jgi:hypothetical protein